MKRVFIIHSINEKDKEIFIVFGTKGRAIKRIKEFRINDSVFKNSEIEQLYISERIVF